MGFKLRRAPLRIAAGAFILNSGLNKRDADEGTAQYLHQGAVTAFPQLQSMEPQKFAGLLSTVETTLGAALLTPFVPAGLAGLGLTAFSGGLIRMYLRTPGASEEGSVAPTPEGLTVAKDVWLLGIGISLLLDGIGEGFRRGGRDDD